MRFGLVVVCFFATVWAVAGLAAAGLPRVAWLAAILVSLGVGIVGWRRAGEQPARDTAENARIGKLVGIASGVEGLVILVAVNICINIGAPQAVLPCVAIIVGLHFLPLARYMPAPEYYAVAAAMTVLGVSGLAIPAPYSWPTVGFGCAAVLWAADLLLSGRRARMARSDEPPA